MPGPVHVFIACSLDGFIAGVGDDLSWLPGSGGDDASSEPDRAPEADAADDHGFGAFFERVGALLMGRRTYDVVRGFEGDWFYGDKPVLVATSRPLGEPAAPTVRAVSGSPAELLDVAHEAAGEGIVYVDGGVLIRSFLDAGLIDEMTVSIIPVILGAGIQLFAGAARRTRLELLGGGDPSGALVQLRYRPLR